jgi:hypothetical protein
MSDLSGSVLRNYKIPVMQIGKEISSFEHLHNDVDIFLVLKNIVKTID